MTRSTYAHVSLIILAFALVGCPPKAPPATTPEARATPTVEAAPAPTEAPATLDQAELNRWHADLLRAEDLRVVDEATRAAARSPHAPLRVLASRSLARIGGEAATGLLRDGLGDPLPEVRVEAAIGLGRWASDDDAIAAALVGATKDQDAAVRAAAGLALGLRRDAGAGPSLARLLEDSDPGVVAAATVAVTRLESADFAVAPLGALVRDPRPGVAPSALHALSRLAAGRSLGFAARRSARETLVQLASTELPVGLHVLVARGLRVPEGAAQLEALDTLFASEDYRVRVAVLDALTFPGSPIEPFVKALADEDQRVVMTAVRASPRVANLAFLRELVNLTIYDDRDWLRALAVEAMARLAPAETTKMVNGLSRDVDASVRLAAAYALVGRSDDDAMIYANRMLSDADPRVRGAAASALVGSADELELLFEPLLDDDAVPVLEGRIRAAGLRLADRTLPAALHGDAVAELHRVWASTKPENVELRRLMMEAAAQGTATPELRELLESGLGDPTYHVRSGAVDGIKRVFGEDRTVRLGVPSLRGRDDYLRIVEWASRPRAALVTVERPGSGVGVFTLRLDTENSPLAAWNFARLAESGYFRGAPLDPTPLRRLTVRNPEERLGPGYTIRDEPSAAAFSTGTAVMTRPGADAAAAEFFITLAPSPELSGGHTAFASVVRNFGGVVERCLPGDRIGTVHVYAGDGSEELPPTELIP